MKLRLEQNKKLMMQKQIAAEAPKPAAAKPKPTLPKEAGKTSCKSIYTKTKTC